MIPSDFTKDDCSTAAEARARLLAGHARRRASYERRPVALPPPPPPPVRTRKPEPLPPAPVVAPPAAEPPPLVEIEAAPALPPGAVPELPPGSYIATRIGLRAVMLTVSTYFNLDPIDLISARRIHNFARARQIGMYIASRLTPFSYPAIGRAFGRYDHSTAIHAVNKIKGLLAAGDPAIIQAVETISGHLRAVYPNAAELKPRVRIHVPRPGLDRHGTPWTDDEVAHLVRRYCEEKQPAKIVAHELGRTMDTVNRKAVELGYYRRPPPKRGAP